MPRKADRLRNMSGEPSGWVGAPVLGQIQLAVDEGMAGGGHVGEKDAHLAVFHAPGPPAILGADARRVAPAFGKAAFIQDQHRKGHIVRFIWQQLRTQGLSDQGAHVIAHPILVPDGLGEQALDAIGMGLPGLFSDLPAIFAGHVTEHGLQVVQGLLVDFGAREVGTQPRMQLAQVLVPPADLAERGPGLHGCGMLRVLHAVLAFDEGRCEKGCNF